MSYISCSNCKSALLSIKHLYFIAKHNLQQPFVRPNAIYELLRDGPARLVSIETKNNCLYDVQCTNCAHNLGGVLGEGDSWFVVFLGGRKSICGIDEKGNAIVPKGDWSDIRKTLYPFTQIKEISFKDIGWPRKKVFDSLYLAGLPCVASKSKGKEEIMSTKLKGKEETLSEKLIGKEEIVSVDEYIVACKCCNPSREICSFEHVAFLEQEKHLFLCILPHVFDLLLGDSSRLKISGPSGSNIVCKFGNGRFGRLMNVALKKIKSKKKYPNSFFACLLVHAVNIVSKKNPDVEYVPLDSFMSWQESREKNPVIMAIPIKQSSTLLVQLSMIQTGESSCNTNAVTALQKIIPTPEEIETRTEEKENTFLDQLLVECRNSNEIEVANGKEEEVIPDSLDIEKGLTCKHCSQIFCESNQVCFVAIDGHISLSILQEYHEILFQTSLKLIKDSKNRPKDKVSCSKCSGRIGYVLKDRVCRLKSMDFIKNNLKLKIARKVLKDLSSWNETRNNMPVLQKIPVLNSVDCRISSILYSKYAQIEAKVDQDQEIAETQGPSEIDVEKFVKSLPKANETVERTFLVSLKESGTDDDRKRLVELLFSRVKDNEMVDEICTLLLIYLDIGEEIGSLSLRGQIIRTLQDHLEAADQFLSGEVEEGFLDMDDVKCHFALLGRLVNLGIMKGVSMMADFVVNQFQKSTGENKERSLEFLEIFISKSRIRLSGEHADILRQGLARNDLKERLEKLIAHSQSRNQESMRLALGNVKEAVCLQCHEKGHFAFSCPTLKKPDEALGFVKNEPTKQYLNSVNNASSSRDVAVFQRYRSLLVKEGKFIDYRILTDDLCGYYRVYSFYKLPSTIKDLLDGLKRMISSIYSYVFAARATSLLITLHDLEKILMTNSDFSNLNEFEELQLGPLVLHPAVREVFHPSDRVLSSRKVPEVTAEEIYEYIAESMFMSGHPITSGMDISFHVERHKIDLENVLKSFAEKKGCESLNDLCIFIRAPSFVTFLMSRMNANDMRSRRSMQRSWDMAYKNRLRSVANSALKKGVSTFASLDALLKNSSDILDRYGLIRNYVRSKDLSSTQMQFLVLLAIERISPLSGKAKALQSILQREAVVAREMLPVIRSIDPEDSILQSLVNAETRFFDVIKAESPDDSPISFLQFIAKHKDLGNVLNSLYGSRTEIASSSVPDRKIMESIASVERNQVIGCINNCLKSIERSQETVLSFLLTLENEVRNVFGVRSLESLGYTCFLSFCSSNESSFPEMNPALRQLLSSSSIDELYWTVKEFFESIRRIRHFEASSFEDSSWERLIIVANLHFGIDIEEFLEKLEKKRANELREVVLGSYPSISRSPILAAWAIAFMFEGMKTDTFHQLLPANQVLNEAQEAIGAAPFLKDIGHAVHWSERFQFSLGKLGPFLQQNVEGQKFAFLEVSAGIFVKVELQPSIEGFLNALQEMNATLSASCPVSFVAKTGSVGLAPLQLLSEQVMLWIKTSSVEALPLSRFLLSTLILIPQPLRFPVWTTVFWAPISSIFPDAKNLVCTVCQSSYEASVLQSMGVYLGIVEWQTAIPVSGESQCDPKEDAKDGEKTRKSVDSRPAVLKSSTERTSVQEVPVSVQSPFSSFYTPESAELLSVNECNAVIENIKRRFGYVAEESLSEKELESLNELRALASRSILALSRELYSEDVHFILELIQNADDNCYDDGVAPSLNIRVMDDVMEFFNNEQGFMPENVYALCSIGESTKAKSVSGYIGHKGIGFKSVFKVCANPEVHSKNFHFSFSDASESSLNFVIPTAVPAPKNWHPNESLTLIRLPISNIDVDQSRQLFAAVKEIHSSLLLFLHRISSISIEDARHGTRKVMNRIDHLDGMVSIEEGNFKSDKSVLTQTHDWMVVKEELSVPEGIHRLGMTTTEIIFAIPLVEMGKLSGELEPQNVFCFLPLRSYGLRFVLQADWVTTSSRESVAGSSSWNQWLRDEIVLTFRKVVARFTSLASALAWTQTDPEDERIETESVDSGESLVNEYIEPPSSEEIEKAKYYMDLMFRIFPQPRTVMDFFSHIPEEISTTLQQYAFIPVRRGNFTTPRLAIMPPNEIEDSYLEITERYLNKLNLSFVRYVTIPTSVADMLNLKRFDGRVVLDVLVCAAEEYAEKESVDFAWLAWMIDIIGQDANLGNLVNEYRESAWLPLSSGEFTRPNDGPVYEVADIQVADKYGFVRNNARLLHPYFVQELRPYRHARQVLRLMGVTSTDGHTFVENFVLPMLSDIKEDVDVLISCLSFSFEHSKSCSKCEGGRLEKMILTSWPGVFIVDSFGKKNVVRDCSMHFSVPNGLPKESWPVISEKYLENSHHSAREWEKFFENLEIFDFVHVFKDTMEISWPKLKERLELDNNRELLESLSESCNEDSVFEIDEVVSPDLPIYLDHVISTNDKVKADCLLSDLSRRWSKKEFQYATFRVDDKSLVTVSSVFELLRSRPWVPTDSDLKLRTASTMYYPTNELKHILPNLPYVSRQCSETLAKKLHVPFSITAEGLLELLAGWEMPIRLSQSDMEPIYDFFIRAKKEGFEFAGKKFIFVPTASTRDPKSIQKSFKKGESLSGKLYSIEDIVKDDMSSLIDTDKTTISAPTQEIIKCATSIRRLRPFYRDGPIQKLCLLGVSDKPSFLQYCDILRNVSSVSPPTVEACQIAVRIFCNWAYGDSFDGESADFGNVREVLLQNSWIPTSIGGHWASLGDNLFMNDLREDFEFTPVVYSPLTSNPEDFHVKDAEVNLPKFFRRLGVPTFSECCHASCEAVDIVQEVGAGVEKYISLLVSFIQRWEAWKSRDEEIDVPLLLQELRICYADTLRSVTILIHNGREFKSVHTTEVKRIMLDFQQSTIFLRSEIECDPADFNNAFVDGFSKYVIFARQNFPSALSELRDIYLSDSSKSIIEMLEQLESRLDSRGITGFQLDNSFHDNNEWLPFTGDSDIPPIAIQEPEELIEQSSVSEPIVISEDLDESQGIDPALEAAMKRQEEIRQKMKESDAPQGSLKNILHRSGTKPSIKSKVREEGRYLANVPLIAPAISDFEPEFEEVDFVKSMKDYDMEANSDQSVGWLGERIVAQLIKSDPLYNNVAWLNETSEKYQPYDITANSEFGKQYIEVKTTVDKEKEFFEISLDEILASVRFGSSYVIYRVFGVGSIEDLRVLRIRDPSRHYGKGIKMLLHL